MDYVRLSPKKTPVYNHVNHFETKNLWICTTHVDRLFLRSSLGASPVTAAKNPDQLFTSPDPKLHKIKQVVYHIQKDLLEHGHWELADKYLSEEYIQHNPNVSSGRKAVVDFFTKVLKVKPTPIPAKMNSKVVSVVAEGDLVTVAFAKVEKHPKILGKTYTTTWFDQWACRQWPSGGILGSSHNKLGSMFEILSGFTRKWQSEEGPRIVNKELPCGHPPTGKKI